MKRYTAVDMNIADIKRDSNVIGSESYENKESDDVKVSKEICGCPHSWRY